MSLSPLGVTDNVVIDEETGDIYVWNEELENYVKHDSFSDSTDSRYNYVIVDNGTSSGSSDKVGTSQVADVSGSEVDLSGSSVSAIAEAVAEYAAADGYNLGTSYSSIFAGVAQKIPFHQHYVYWRDDRYSYKMAYGDISLNGHSFTSADSVTVVTYNTNSDYNGIYTFATSIESNFSLNAGSALVYSDLGSYPDIFNRREMKYNVFTSYMCGIAFCWMLFSNLRKSAFGR